MHLVVQESDRIMPTRYVVSMDDNMYRCIYTAMPCYNRAIETRCDDEPEYAPSARGSRRARQYVSWRSWICEKPRWDCQ